MAFRIISTILLFLAVYFLPWWFTILAILVAIFYFDKYYEGVFLILLLDVILKISEYLCYYIGLDFLAGLPVLTILFFILCLILVPIKEKFFDIL